MVRQPIFDGELKVVAYTLLYSGNEDVAALLESSADIALQLLDEYSKVYEGGKIRELPVYLSVPRGKLAGDWNPPVPQGDVILELAAETCGDAEVSALQKLTEQGYKIAFKGCPSSLQLLQLAHTVKLDGSKVDADQLAFELARVRSGQGVIALVENIRSLDLLQTVVEQGFDLFQGDFLTKPKVINDGKLYIGQTTLMQIIAAVQDPNASPESVAEIVQCDPVLTYKLLRIVNSAAYSLMREITSVAETVVMLGFEQVKQLAMIVGVSSSDDKPGEIYRSLMIRSHMCEQVAKGLKFSNKSSFFLAGLMSGLHLLFDTSKENLLAQLPIADEIKLAVSEGEGAIGAVLSNTIRYQDGRWDELPADLDLDVYETAYMSAIRWYNNIMEAANQ